ncbi:4509_t:CDS:1 [Dentiscutata heterogama]|uniref:4509_t:CDS:1 n=1 Tax=Dentiscutata heterogama TaxID=1316150 RepID=A0ACA9KSL6_9GLOM|nr:4509_t:CDS:1 [Dentiscutata heterogama]
MTSNNQYDPGNDAINTVIIGILPALVIVLFKGFKNEKRNPSSFINGFDDFIIMVSITINPSFSAFQWLSYDNKTVINMIFGYISLISFCLRSQHRFFSLLNVKEATYFMISFVYLLVALMSLVLMFGYSILVIGNDMDSVNIISFNYIGKLCANNFGTDKCQMLNILNYSVNCTCFGINFLFFIYYFCSNRKMMKKIEEMNKKEKFGWKTLINLVKKLIKFLKDTIFNCFKKNKNDDQRKEEFPWKKLDYLISVMNNKTMNRLEGLIFFLNRVISLTLVIYPAILSGYLLSTNVTLTKIFFAICIISLSRLIEHFGDNEPEKITTIISYYLNYNSNMHIRKLIYDQLEDQKKQLEKIVDQVGFKSKEVINSVKNSLENQIKVISERKVEINEIKDVVKALSRQIKILQEEIKKLQGEIRELQENQQEPQEELKFVATLEEIVKRLETIVEALKEIVKRLELIVKMIVEAQEKKKCKITTNNMNGNANSLPISIN